MIFRSQFEEENNCIIEYGKHCVRHILGTTAVNFLCMYLTFASPDVTCTTDCLDTYGQSDFVPIYSLGLNFANGHVLTPHWSVHNVSDPFLVMELKYHIETIGRHISRAFKAIDAHPNSDRLRRMLRLAIYAVQPLTVYELAEGVATGEMINVWDPARIVTDSMSLIND